MKNIDIEKLHSLKEILKDFKEDDVSFIEENGEPKFVIMPVSQFDYLESLESFSDESLSDTSKSSVKILTSIPELTFEEYENIKSQLLDSLEKTLKPKKEKLN